MILRKRLDHETPFWIGSDAEFFLTICAEPRDKNHFCHPKIGAAILDFIRLYNERHHWFCDVAVLMPDHIHLLVSFPPEKTVSQVVGLWKRGLAKSSGIKWQRNFFEHRMRHDESMQQKSDYLLNNPVRAGLIDDPIKWSYLWLANRD
jgi:putative transposase